MKRIVLGIVSAVALLVAVTAAGLGLIHLTDFPYTLDLDGLDIPAASGVPRAQALENYRAVMRYLSPFSKAEFTLPTLAFSPDGAAHFADCKAIFTGVYLAGAVCAALAALLVFTGALRDSRTLRVSGIATLALPAVLFAAVAVDFDRAFVLFHTLFFPGATNWIFDPRVDPVIEILPETFFLHCALLIAGLWAAAGVVQMICANRRAKKEGSGT